MKNVMQFLRWVCNAWKRHGTIRKMRSMMIGNAFMLIACRDVVLIPFPFRDRLAEKTRPAVVVSSDLYNDQGDIVVAAITSQPLRFPTDYELMDWKHAGLQYPSTVRILVASVAI